jgi:hypothetical protein
MKTMKINNLLLLAITALSLGMTSCSQSEDAAENTGKQTITFISGDDTLNQAQTRTSMGGAYTASSFPFYWEKDDAIWVNAADHITGDNTGTASYALFIGDVSTSAPYNIRYTGTGSYTSDNQRDATCSFTTSSNASTLVIPPLQTMATLGSTTHFGASGDCGTATATALSNGAYRFKLNHQAAYLILMPRWGSDGATNTTWKLKSVIVTTHKNDDLISGRFSFNDSGIGGLVANTNGSATIKVTTGSNDGILLPTTKGDQTKSINIAIKPIASTDLYCIYDVSDGTNDYYICKIIKAADKTQGYGPNTITPITADLKKGYDMARLGQDANGNAVSGGPYLDLITNTNIYYNYCEWDVPNGEKYFINHEMQDDYNGAQFNITDALINAADGAANWATHSDFSAANLPTYNQMTWYMKGTCYWDANKVWGPGGNQKGGAWFKKKQTILADENIDGNTFNTTQSGARTHTPTSGRPATADINKWFFLPAIGLYLNGSLSQVGTNGYYWSSTPHKVATYCSTFCFQSQSFYLEPQCSSRAHGHSMWTLQ